MIVFIASLLAQPRKHIVATCSIDKRVSVPKRDRQFSIKTIPLWPVTYKSRDLDVRKSGIIIFTCFNLEVINYFNPTPPTDPDDQMISNSNWTQWSTVQGVIERVISNRPKALGWFEIILWARLLSELYDIKSNY